MNAIRDWLMAREPRERVLVIAGAAVLFLSVFFLLVWEPIIDGRAQAEKRVAAKQALLLQIQQAGTQLMAARAGGGQPLTRGSLLTIVDRTMRDAGLANARKNLTPDGNNKVRLQFDDAPFNALVSWLSQLSNRHQIQVNNIIVDRQSRAGAVDVRLILERT